MIVQNPVVLNLVLGRRQVFSYYRTGDPDYILSSSYVTQPAALDFENPSCITPSSY